MLRGKGHGVRGCGAALIVAVSMAALSACGDDKPSGSTTKSTSATTPTPTASATTGTLLDHIPAEPQRPEDVKSKAGAIAFASYTPLVSAYATGNGKPDALTQIADPNLCKVCKLVATNTNKLSGAGAIEVREAPLKVDDAKVINVDGEIATVRLHVLYAKGAFIDRKTGKVFEKLNVGESTTTVNIRWVDDRWLLLDYTVED